MRQPGRRTRKTLYITDSRLNNAAEGITGHTDTLYVYNANTGWTTYPLPASARLMGREQHRPKPGHHHSRRGRLPQRQSHRGAHLVPQRARSATYASMDFYPQGDSVTVQTDVLAATTDGKHILGAALVGGGIELSDIGVTIPTGECPTAAGNTLAGRLPSRTPSTRRRSPSMPPPSIRS